MEIIDSDQPLAHLPILSDQSSQPTIKNTISLTSISKLLNLDPASTHHTDFLHIYRASDHYNADDQAQVYQRFMRQKKIAKRERARNRASAKNGEKKERRAFVEQGEGVQGSENERQRKSRISAQQSRDNKKKYLKNLQEQNRNLKTENQYLRTGNWLKMGILLWLLSFYIHGIGSLQGQHQFSISSPHLHSTLHLSQTKYTFSEFMNGMPERLVRLESHLGEGTMEQIGRMTMTVENMSEVMKLLPYKDWTHILLPHKSKQLVIS